MLGTYLGDGKVGTYLATRVASNLESQKYLDDRESSTSLLRLLRPFHTRKKIV